MIKFFKRGNVIIYGMYIYISIKCKCKMQYQYNIFFYLFIRKINSDNGLMI